MTAILENLGYPFHIVDTQLAHAKKGSLDDAYDRALYLKERTSMMHEWADYIDGLKVVKLFSRLDFRVLCANKKRVPVVKR